MKRPARKLRITGKGRCNITNIAPVNDFISHFGKNGKFIYSAISRFGVDDLIALLNDLGIETIIERGGRVFPASSNAQDVVDCLADWVKSLNVHIRTSMPVTEISANNGVVTNLKAGDRSIKANRVIIATGGASYAATGSSGDGYRLAESIGHTIIPIQPSLVPLISNDAFLPNLHLLQLKNVNVKLFSERKQISELFGEMLFHDQFLTGPVILTLSRFAVTELKLNREVAISIDLKPALDAAKLDARLVRDFAAAPNRKLKTILKDLLPSKLIDVCLDLTSLDPDKTGNQITVKDRQALIKWLKDFRISISEHAPLDQAIVTSGGVNLKEIDPRTMQSKLISNLFFAGEVIDLDADTGGYNLQAAFSTGWLAGESAATLVG